ncbi:MAG TPA: nucleotidyltransferase family protein [Holophagaceae bacterium]|nr:nucleotidyltransferase family protein [Holophagaceae bacterium]
MTARCGLVLLTGGRGARLGGPKHGRSHPQGGSWGGHLVSVFRAVAPEGPVQLIGDPLPDHPSLPRLEDPREGPAVALRAWAVSAPPPSARWWVVACDQPRWTAAAFASWLSEAEAADPMGEAWDLVVREGHRQPLGGFLGAALLPSLARAEGRSLHALMDGLPSLQLPGRAWAGEDIDTPEDLAAFIRPPARPTRL